MTFKRIIAVMLTVLLLLTTLPEIVPEIAPEILPAAQAAPSVKGCTKSQDGKHAWYSRPRNAWCDYSGGLVWVCSHCSKTVFEETTPALGHDWAAWKVTKAATCTKKGTQKRVCNRCRKEETKSIAALGHKWGKKTYTKEPDCTHQGEYYRICTRCGEKGSWRDKALGHDWGKEALTKKPDCTHEGAYTSTCSRCKETKVVKKVNALGHAWDAGVVTKAPTATEDGIKTYTCKRDPSHTKTEAIPATGVDDSPQPSLHLTVKWDEDAGEGKRYEGAVILLYYTVTNTGDCTVYADSADYVGLELSTLEFPNGTAYVPAFGASMAAIDPGQSWSYTSQYHVSAEEAAYGSIDYDDEGLVVDSAQWIDTDGGIKYVGSNNGVIHIPLTYPDGDEPEEEKPELKLTREEDTIYHDGKKYETIDPGILDPDDAAVAFYKVINTGNVPLKVVEYETYGDGTAEMGLVNVPSSTLMPGKYNWAQSGSNPITKHMTPGSETDELLGTTTVSVYCVGYAPDTYVSAANPGKELCRTETITRTWKIGKDGNEPEDGGPHPAISVRIWADPDAGVGMRYEGAFVPFHYEVTNTGDCPAYVRWWPSLHTRYHNATAPNGHFYAGELFGFDMDVALLNPGETYYHYQDSPVPVNADDVERGYFTIICYGDAFYFTANGHVDDVYEETEELKIDLTGPEPEEAKPELKITWMYDEIVPNGDKTKAITTTEPGVLSPEDAVIAHYFVTNTGNVPLEGVEWNYWGNGKSYFGWVPHLAPGNSSKVHILYSWPVTEKMTPGTETEDLLGTTTVKGYCIGIDPETFVGGDDYIAFASTTNHGKELCRTETITRTWKVGKNVQPEDPGDSNLSGKLEVRPGYESSDPAGYVLGEPVSTVLSVENAGIIDIESFTVSDPWDDTTFTDGPIAVGEEKSYIRAEVTVTEDDVEKGYIEFPMITISWTDPDTKAERTAFAGPLTVPVLKKTGLLLKKGYEAPKDGETFAEGEEIKWTLSVTNNSKESITDVKVDDQGVNVGAYAELKPNDKENCAVPAHTVTEYEAKVVGYVLNYAAATGTDYLGATKTWPSNVAKAITKKPTAPGEDPKGDPYGLHPAVSIIKAEDPAGPANGSYYEADEAIKYTITVKNVGDTELKDIAVTDSLAGFAPIGTKDSLAPNEEKTFDYSYTVKEEDLPYQWIYNSATVTYTFGDNVKGTPMTSNTVKSKVGGIDDPFPPTLPHLDPNRLPKDDDWCRLALDALGGTEARYTLHACASHAEAAMAAEEAAQGGDWKAAAEIWKAEVEELYEALYNAADSQLKGALVRERAVFYDYIESFDPLAVNETVRSMKANVDSLYSLLLAAADESRKAELLAEKEKLCADIDASYGGSEAEARANALRLKCAFLCCALHTVPDTLPSSLAGSYAQMLDGVEAAETARVFGALDGTDSEVTETYAGAALKAQNDVLDLLNSSRSYNADKVFARGRQLWQIALDSDVDPLYKAADDEQRILIAVWRISLDTMCDAEKDFLSLLYELSDATQQEQLMALYKDAVLFADSIR